MLFLFIYVESLQNKAESLSMLSGSLTIDVEEYFQVEAFANEVKKSDWQSMTSRIEYQTKLILELLSETQSKATFFILGWVAQKHPELVKEIATSGHEIASHGMMHTHISKQTESEFEQDIQQAKSLLEDIIGHAVLGYRAPSFSISVDNDWAHNCIAEAGYQYSSSIYPVKHDIYGAPDCEIEPFYLPNGLLEIPVSVGQVRGKNVPIAGGGYFRLMPYFVFKQLLKSLQQDNHYMFYTHPWEFDPKQPKIKSNWKSEFRHYINQDKMLSKLKKLSSEKSIAWDTVSNNYLNKEYQQYKSWQEAAHARKYK